MHSFSCRFNVDSPCFFTPAIHSRVVQFILDRKKFSDNQEKDFAFGIERLLNDSVYTAAYPLHDVRYLNKKKYNLLVIIFIFRVI